MNISTIKTDVGELWGRDAIYLDREKYDQGGKSLTLVGEVNGTLCTEVQSDAFISYSICFKEVSSFNKIELDDWLNLEKPFFHETSSFYKLENDDKDKIYIFQTYDLVYEVSAKNYEIQFSKNT